MSVADMKVVDLRARLKDLGLPTNGLKAQLVERLETAYENNPKLRPDAVNAPQKEKETPVVVPIVEPPKPPQEDDDSSSDDEDDNSVIQQRLQDQVLKAQKEQERLQFLLEQAKDSLEKTREQMRLKDDSLASFQKDKDAVNKRLDAMQKQVEQFQFSNDVKDEQIEKLKNSSKKKKQKLITLEGQLKEEKHKREVAQFEMSREQDSVQAKNDSQRRSEQAIKELRSQVDSLQKQLKSKPADSKTSSHAESDREELTRKWKAEFEKQYQEGWKRKLDQANEQVKELEIQLQESNEKVCDAEQLLQEKDKELEVERRQVAQQKQDLDRQSKDIEEILTDLEQQKKLLAEEAQRIRAKEVARSTSGDIEELLLLEHHQNEETAALSLKIQDLEKANSDLKYEKIAVEEKRSTTEKKMQQLQAILLQFKTKAEKEISLLKGANVELIRERDELRKRVNLNDSKLEDTNLDALAEILGSGPLDSSLLSENSEFTMSGLAAPPRLSQSFVEPSAVSTKRKNMRSSLIPAPKTVVKRSENSSKSKSPRTSRQSLAPSHQSNKSKLPVRRGSSLLPSEMKKVLLEKN
eukprot:TRINITY_DN6488_c0_g1_i1.p1 TRINITY_DN6488_c0_g1~~TRINITY_DN6488_c0_g1_i1.p1  ORF type:complete len:623 (-),score=210.72 TRINITY_DN6488_c0_g1_i1:362-2101(-)